MRKKETYRVVLARLPGSGGGGAGKAVGAAADTSVFWLVLLPLLFPLLSLLLSLTAPGRPFLRAPGVERVLVRHTAHLTEAEDEEEEGRKKRPLLCKYRYT